MTQLAVYTIYHLYTAYNSGIWYMELEKFGVKKLHQDFSQFTL